MVVRDVYGSFLEEFWRLSVTTSNHHGGRVSTDPLYQDRKTEALSSARTWWLNIQIVEHFMKCKARSFPNPSRCAEWITAALYTSW